VEKKVAVRRGSGIKNLGIARESGKALADVDITSRPLFFDRPLENYILSLSLTLSPTGVAITATELHVHNRGML
jgi:hypothetical protein